MLETRRQLMITEMLLSKGKFKNQVNKDARELNTELDNMTKLLEQLMKVESIDDGIKFQEENKYINEMKDMIEEYSEKAGLLIYQQEFLKIDSVERFEQLIYLNTWIEPLFHMWELISNWRYEKDRWYMSKFDKLDLEEI